MPRSVRVLAVVSAVSTLAAIAACSGDDSGPPATHDAGGPYELDSGTDAGHDATAEAHDAALDAAADATADATPAKDAAGDVTTDAPSDSSADSASDAHHDGATDAAPDAPSDAGVDAAADAGSDAADAAIAFIAPTCDGVIAAGEYGSQVEGQNQQTSTGGQTWYVTWSDTTVYVGITSATTSEAAVLYFSNDPSLLADADSGTDGTNLTYSYDSDTVDLLPMYAQSVAYVKDSYNETRAAGGGGWGAPVANAITVCTSGTTREFSIPWTTLTGTASRTPGAPAGFLGYVTSGTGFLYGQVPPGNPSGNLSAATYFPWLYEAPNTTPVTGAFPFASPVQR